ncbi:MAG: hypothetical protein IPM79_38715 [Polyangiaceae bacterium]|jgi:hypothetical protein|nr:hypothetical protein [Polyangiaceae bacterium]
MVEELNVREPSSRTSRRRWVGALVAAAAACGVFLAAPGDAHAQTAETNPVTSPGKGIVGGALLGAEVVMIPMGAAGLKPWWPYLVFGAVGAAGGAVGGWAVEQNVEEAEPALYMLAGGLALIIPAVVLTLNATTKQDYEDTQDPSALTTTPSDGQTPPGEAVPGQAPPGGTTTTTIQPTSDARRVRKVRPAPRPPTTLLELASNEVRIGVPAIQVRNMYSQDELARFGLEQQTEVQVPVVGVSF